jgi:HK97 family phage major capsid protein
MMETREMLEKRAAVDAEQRAILEAAKGEERELTPEEDEKWDKLDKDFKDLTEKIRKQEDRDATLAAQSDELEKTRERVVRITGNNKVDVEDLDEQHKRWFRNYLRGTIDDEDRAFLGSPEGRALAEQTKGTDGEGGYTVPVDFRASVIEAQKAWGGMRRSRATVFTTDNGRNLDIPTLDDTGNVASIVAEATGITASTGVPFLKVTMEAAKYKSGPIKISPELLEDSAVDVEAIVRDAMAIRFGRGSEAHFATRSSTESAGPHGLVNASTAAVADMDTSDADSAQVDRLVDLVHAVNPAYRGQAEWMFHDTFLAKLRKVTDSQNRPIYQPGLIAGAPDRLLGYPVIINQHLPAWPSTSGAIKGLWFGDFSAYYIRDVASMRVRRLEELYAASDMIALLAFQRLDGRPAIGNIVQAEKPLQYNTFST